MEATLLHLTNWDGEHLEQMETFANIAKDKIVYFTQHSMLQSAA